MLTLFLALNDLDLQNFRVTGLACHHNSFKTKIMKISPLVFEIQTISENVITSCKICSALNDIDQVRFVS